MTMKYGPYEELLRDSMN